LKNVLESLGKQESENRTKTRTENTIPWMAEYEYRNRCDKLFQLSLEFYSHKNLAFGF